MELTTPTALLLLVAVVPAWWLARRGGGHARIHPLWFLIEPRARARPARRRRAPITRLLLVAVIALLALAAAGPVAIDRGGARVVVVDLSATRALDVDAVRARIARADQVVLVAPGAPPVRVPAAAAELIVGAGTVDAAELAAGIALATPGAASVELIAAPPPGADVAIAAAAFHRDPLAPRRGQLVATVTIAEGAAPPSSLVVRDRNGVERGRVAVVVVDGVAIVALPYAGDGAELLTLTIDPPGDALAADDTAVVEVPPLTPAAVWIDPALADTPLARAVAVQPTAVLVAAPADDAIAVVPTSAWRGPARAVLLAPPVAAATAVHEPLVAVPGSPLPGATAELLAASPAVDLDPDAGAGVDPSRVWLRGGPHAAVFALEHDGRPAVQIAARLDGALLPVLLADLLAASPLLPPSRCAVIRGGPRQAGVSETPACAIVQPDVRAPVAVPAARTSPARPRRAWPIRALLGAAALLLLIEAGLVRPRRFALLGRVVALAALVALTWRAAAPVGRRVVFVVDASASLAPVEAEVRAALARHAAALSPDDRAAVVVVAGGAVTAIGLGDPSAIASWARLPLDPRALGLDPARTDLAAGLAAADALLGGGPGDLVVISDGRDSEGGAAALRASPALVGRGVELVPIDAGGKLRVEVAARSLRAMPGRRFALEVVIESRIAAAVEIVVSERGLERARRTVDAAAGRTAWSLPIVLDQPGLAALDIAVAGARARAIVEVAGPPRVLRVRAADASLLTPAALDGVDTVILDDVPGSALPAGAAAALDGSVSGGATLLWAAGPAVEAGGAGAVAPLLPLRAGDAAPVALMLIVDRSGSIDAGGRLGTIPDAAELAAVAAALEPGDHLGALGFDVAPIEWLALQPVGALVTVPPAPAARGGTDPSSALDLAADRLAALDAATRRVAVLVSDGGFAAAEAPTLAAARRLAGAGIRLDVIAIGSPDDDDRARLAAIAAAGAGRLHDRAAAGLPGTIPALRITAGPAGAVAPLRIRDAWAALLGAPPTAVAQVGHHLAMRPTADAIVLADAGADSLLALRPHGAGRVLAFTADLAGVWIDPAIAAALIAAAPIAPTGAELLLTAGPLPRTILIELVGPELRALRTRALVRHRDGDDSITLTPGAPGHWSAITDAEPGRVAVSVGTARAELVVVDPEHAGLGVDRTLSHIAPPRSSSAPDVGPWRGLVGACALGIIMLLIAIPRRDR